MSDQEYKQKILQYMQEHDMDVLPDLGIVSKMGICSKTLYKRYGSLRKLAEKFGIQYEYKKTCPTCGKEFYTRHTYMIFCREKCQDRVSGRPNTRNVERNLFRPLTKEDIPGIAGDIRHGSPEKLIAEICHYDLEHLKNEMKMHELEIKREIQFQNSYHKNKAMGNEGRMTHTFQRPYETKVKRNIYGAMG